MSKDLVYATSDHTVHLAQGTVDNQFGSFEIVEGLTLKAGQTYPLAKLAKYQQESIKAGEVAGLELVSEKEANDRSEALAKLQALVAGAPQQYATDKLLGDDGSFSDHLVSDAQKIANHVAQAGGDDAGVAQAEDEDAPVYGGVETDPELVEKVVKEPGGEKADKKASKSDDEK